MFLAKYGTKMNQKALTLLEPLTPNKMDLQTDINWIKTELDKVQDPDFLNALKGMFNYRNKKASLPTSFFTTSKEDLENRAEASLASVEKGNTRNISEFKNDVENWKNQQAI